MTGRELIIYILQNNLEDKVILSKEEAAVKHGVGINTIELMYNLGMVQGIKIYNNLYIFTEPETLKITE